MSDLFDEAYIGDLIKYFYCQFLLLIIIQSPIKLLSPLLAISPARCFIEQSD